MKLKLLVLVFLLFVGLAQAQENREIKKPQRVYILNDSRIVTENEVNEIAKSGYVKNVVSGATDEERQSYQAKFGNVIGDNFIARIYTLTEEEKKEKAKNGDVVKIAKSAATQVASKNNSALKVGDIARDFKVDLVDGTHVQLSDLKGKVVLLNFWATWCQPCIMEFHELPEAILQKYKTKDFVFLPISRGEPKERVQKTLAKLKEKGIDINSGLDPQEDIWKLYEGGGLPLNYILDKEGVVKYVSMGYGEPKLKEMSVLLDSLLK